MTSSIDYKSKDKSLSPSTMRSIRSNKVVLCYFYLISGPGLVVERTIRSSRDSSMHLYCSRSWRFLTLSSSTMTTTSDTRLLFHTHFLSPRISVLLHLFSHNFKERKLLLGSFLGSEIVTLVLEIMVMERYLYVWYRDSIILCSRGF